MDWKELALNFSCSRLFTAIKQFTEGTLQDMRCRALGLLNDLRASRVTLQGLGRVEAIDCVCQERTRGISVITPLHEDAAGRVIEHLRRRVQQYRTTLGEEYRTLVPTTRKAFERGFDDFVDRCLKDRKKNTEQWFEELVSSGSVESDLRCVYIHFQQQLREACLEQSKFPLPPPLFRMECAPNHSTKHRRCCTEPPIPGPPLLSKHRPHKTVSGQSMYKQGMSSWQSEGRPEHKVQGVSDHKQSRDVHEGGLSRNCFKTAHGSVNSRSLDSAKASSTSDGNFSKLAAV